MAAMSTYLEDALLDHVFGNTAFTQPALWLALFNADPTDDNVTANEISGGSYGRLTISFGAASLGSVSNDAQVSFTDMPADTVTHAAIYDASTVGNLLVHGALTASRVVNAGDTFNVPAGNYTVTAN